MVCVVSRCSRVSPESSLRDDLQTSGCASVLCGHGEVPTSPFLASGLVLPSLLLGWSRCWLPSHHPTVGSHLSLSSGLGAEPGGACLAMNAARAGRDGPVALALWTAGVFLRERPLAGFRVECRCCLRASPGGGQVATVGGVDSEHGRAVVVWGCLQGRRVVCLGAVGQVVFTLFSSHSHFPQGTFPHGIDIVTTADYFAVGNRANCFLVIR